MIKIWILFFLLIFSGCSLDTKSGIWTKDKEIKKVEKNINKIFKEKDIIIKEFNSNLLIKIDKSKILKKKINGNTNNSGLSLFNEEIKRSSKFNFKKIDNFSYFEPELVSDGKNFIFFDDKSNLLKFDKDFKLIWKINIYNNQIFVVDLNNILRSYNLKDGTELWKFKSENSFLKSNKRNSLVIKNNIVYFNNSLGDILAVNINEGSLIWQTPTQSSSIYENAFSLKMSDLVISKEDLIFSNNKNEIYSINLMSGILNWKQNINSSVRPVIINDFIFTVSNEGYLFTLDRYSGNIIKITDVFSQFKTKKRKKIYPIGFVVSEKNILLTTSNGRLLVIDLKSGKPLSILKIDNEKISRPFIFGQKILLVKDNAIIRLN